MLSGSLRRSRVIIYFLVPLLGVVLGLLGTFGGLLLLPVPDLFPVVLGAFSKPLDFAILSKI